jgi:3-oxoadipate enol-lactonase
MTSVAVNGIDINYRLEGEGPETIVLVNGLADDLETWGYQVGDLLAAGLRVLRFDNRGVGATTKALGPYTTRLFAEDTKALVDHLGIADFHLAGVSMGGMIAQEYALAWPADLRSVTFACTYAAPGPFCSKMFDFWADLATFNGVSIVMRDVTLWAFTPAFFETRPDEAAEFEAAMKVIDQPLAAYLSQLHAIQHHDTTDRLSAITTPVLVLAGEEDILIPVPLSKRLADGVAGSVWATTPGGHACVWEHPSAFNQALIGFISHHRKD